VSLVVWLLPGAGDDHNTSDTRIWLWMQRIGGVGASRGERVPGVRTARRG
jgi:hypothetical protein